MLPSPFGAVLSQPEQLPALLAATPELPHVRMIADVLVDGVHWLYGGDTPLHLAAAALRVAAAGVLLAHAADPNATNRRGAAPLHYACDPRPSASASRDRNVQTGERRWDPDAQAASGSLDPDAQAALIALLVDHGADPDATDRGGATPLHRAVRARSPAAVRQLLACGARTDARLRTRGSTPLHLASQSTGAGGTAGSTDAQLEIIRLLLAHGADPAAVDLRGQTPADWATNHLIRTALTS